jgi:hypothetical protein
VLQINPDALRLVQQDQFATALNVFIHLSVLAHTMDSFTLLARFGQSTMVARRVSALWVKSNAMLFSVMSPLAQLVLLFETLKASVAQLVNHVLTAALMRSMATLTSSENNGVTALLHVILAHVTKIFRSHVFERHVHRAFQFVRLTKRSLRSLAPVVHPMSVSAMNHHAMILSQFASPTKNLLSS